MKPYVDRSHAVGCLALPLVAGGLYYLASDPRARERRDRGLALREECIRAGRPAARMSREKAGDLVGRCFGEARRDSHESLRVP